MAHILQSIDPALFGPEDMKSERDLALLELSKREPVPDQEKEAMSVKRHFRHLVKKAFAQKRRGLTVGLEHATNTPASPTVEIDTVGLVGSLKGIKRTLAEVVLDEEFHHYFGEVDLTKSNLTSFLRRKGWKWQKIRTAMQVLPASL